jgi:TolB protein
MTSFKWSPDGDHIALLSSSDDTSTYDHLSLVDPNNGSERMLASGELIAFWWAPNSQYIVIVARHPDLVEAMRWTSIDLATGRFRALIDLIPSSEFGFLQTYFSQYAQSHELWSPDSSSLVMAGVKLDDATLKSVLANGFVDLVSQIWIVDARDGAAYAVAKGSLAFWSPQ